MFGKPRQPSISPSLTFLVQLLLGPAIVAAGVSLYVTNQTEKRRARRDFLTKAYGDAREAIAKATEHAIEYFSVEGTRTPKQEAYVSMYEREVRRNVSYIQEKADLSCQSQIDAVTITLVDFLAALTGGDFQDPVGKADLEHIRNIGFTSVALRLAIQELRNAELTRDLKRTPLSRSLEICRQMDASVYGKYRGAVTKVRARIGRRTRD